MRVAISDDIFDKNPRLAYAMLGFADGKTGARADPPRGEHRGTYMREFAEGMKPLNKGPR